jgi:hypothetical protein
MPRACAMRHDLLDRHDGAERVRHLGDGDDLRARRQQLLEFLDQEIAVVVDRRPFDHRALALARKCQGTMLEWCSMIESTISSPSRISRGRTISGDEVDRLGGVAGEDDLSCDPR